MAIPGLVAASNLADTENKEAVWDNLGNGIESVVLATNFIPNSTMVGAVVGPLPMLVAAFILVAEVVPVDTRVMVVQEVQA